MLLCHHGPGDQYHGRDTPCCAEVGKRGVPAVLSSSPSSVNQARQPHSAKVEAERAAHTPASVRQPSQDTVRHHWPYIVSPWKCQTTAGFFRRYWSRDPTRLLYEVKRHATRDGVWLLSCKPRENGSELDAELVVVPSSKQTRCLHNDPLERRHSWYEGMDLSPLSEIASSRLSSEGDSESTEQHSSDTRMAACTSRSRSATPPRKSPRTDLQPPLQPGLQTVALQMVPFMVPVPLSL